jgi:hypothetical protein
MRLGIFSGGAGEADTLESLITQARQAETAGFDSFSTRWPTRVIHCASPLKFRCPSHSLYQSC